MRPYSDVRSLIDTRYDEARLTMQLLADVQELVELVSTLANRTVMHGPIGARAHQVLQLAYKGQSPSELQVIEQPSNPLNQQEQ